MGYWIDRHPNITYLALLAAVNIPLTIWGPGWIHWGGAQELLNAFR